MLRKLFLSLTSLSALFAWIGGSSCGPAPADPNTRSLLWEVSGNGLKEKSYVFGTIHIIGEKDFFFPKNFEKAFLKTNKLVMEINMSDMLGQMDAMSKAVLDSNRTLADLYSEDDYTFIRKTALDSFGVNIDFFATMKPIFVQQNVMAQGELKDGMQSYELYLMNLAMSHQMAMDGLETAAEQMQILDSIPLQKQADMLLESMKDISTSRREIKKMIGFYKEQNLDSLQAMFEEEEDFKEHQGSLLDNRNRKWIPKIEALMQEGPVFIAVGAGHLGGKNGVLQLLRDKGYTLRPVISKD